MDERDRTQNDPAGAPDAERSAGADGALTADDRYAAAVASRISEGRNRPTGLLWAGAAAVLAAGIAVSLSLRAHAEAEGEVSSARSRLTRVSEVIGEIAYLRALGEADGTVSEGVEVVPRRLPLSRIEALAGRVGLENELPVPNPRSTLVDEQRGIFRISYPYTVRDRSLPNLLEWTRLVTDEIEAMRVGQVTLTPQQDRWELRVTFTRYERE